MMLTRENWRDIQKYYDGTFIKIKEEGEVILKVRKVRPEGIELQNDKGEDILIHLRDDSPYDLSFILPHKTVYQVDDKCWAMSRRPMKQYQRGICEQNIAIHVLNSGAWYRKDASFATLAPFVTKQPFQTLLVASKSKTMKSMALSSRFSVDFTTGSVFCDLSIVGSFDKAKKILTINPLFVADINQILVDMGEADIFTVKAIS